MATRCSPISQEVLDSLDLQAVEHKYVVLSSSEWFQVQEWLRIYKVTVRYLMQQRRVERAKGKRG